GIETMDTAAACRTYNVLLAEGRKVVAALLFDAPPASQG
ncbi:MAG: MTH938/NDUFAF3 family protein, partial [Burkholderiales bacterium]